MSLLFGGKEILCDGCAMKICDAPGQHVQRRDSAGYMFTHRTVLSDVFPSDAITLRIWGWADDSGPGSPARPLDSHVEPARRDYCAACAPVAMDKFKETFARLPLVDQLAERE